MNDGEMMLLPQRLKGRERRMQSEEAVEIEDRLPGNVDAGAHGVVLGLAMWDDDVKSIGRAALEDHDQALRTGGVLGGSESGSGQETWHRGRADHGESAVAEKDATTDGHNVTLRRDVACYVLLTSIREMVRETLQATSLHYLL